MAINRKLTDLTEKLSATADSWLHFVDPSDISQSPEGSSFKIKKTNLIPVGITDHESLSNLLGGDINGHYHVSDVELTSIGTIGNKLDKVTSAGVERVYTINADGIQSSLILADSFSGDTHLVQAIGGGLSAFGINTPTTVGSASNLTANYGGVYVSSPLSFSNRRQSVTGVTPGSSAEFYESTNRLVSNNLGYYFFGKCGFTWASGTSAYVGLTGNLTASGNINPSDLLNTISFGVDDTNTQLQIMHNDGTGTATKIPMGVDFDMQPTNAYRFVIWNNYNSSDIHVWVLNLRNNSYYLATINTDIPASSIGLVPHLFVCNRATSNNLNITFSGYGLKRQY